MGEASAIAEPRFQILNYDENTVKPDFVLRELHEHRSYLFSL